MHQPCSCAALKPQRGSPDCRYLHFWSVRCGQHRISKAPIRLRVVQGRTQTTSRHGLLHGSDRHGICLIDQALERRHLVPTWPPCGPLALRARVDAVPPAPRRCPSTVYKYVFFFAGPAINVSPCLTGFVEAEAKGTVELKFSGSASATVEAGAGCALGAPGTTQRTGSHDPFFRPYSVPGTATATSTSSTQTRTGLQLAASPGVCSPTSWSRPVWTSRGRCVASPIGAGGLCAHHAP